MRFRELLATGHIMEGGHAFRDPATKRPLTKQDATTEQAQATVRALEKRLGIDLFKNLTGSAMYPGKTTGDADVNLDPVDYIDVDPSAEAKAEQNRFREWLTSRLMGAAFRDHEIRKTGDGLSVMAPIPGTDEFLQVDLDISEPGQGGFARWARRGEPAQGAKGAFRHIIKSAIARSINPNWKWSFKAGLFDEESGKTLSKDPDMIAKYFFGDSGQANDLDNIKSIMTKLKQTRPNIYQQVVDRANEGIEKLGHDYRVK